jgi:hypothetical protein
MESLDPPAANGTTNVIGLVGQFCAATDEIPTNNAVITAIIRILSGCTYKITETIGRWLLVIVHNSNAPGMSPP